MRTKSAKRGWSPRWRLRRSRLLFEFSALWQFRLKTQARAFCFVYFKSLNPPTRPRTGDHQSIIHSRVLTAAYILASYARDCRRRVSTWRHALSEISNGGVDDRQDCARCQTELRAGHRTGPVIPVQQCFPALPIFVRNERIQPKSDAANILSLDSPQAPLRSRAKERTT
jgi:hypothetical protein